VGEGEGVGERVWVTHMIVVVDDDHDGANDDQKRRDVQITPYAIAICIRVYRPTYPHFTAYDNDHGAILYEKSCVVCILNLVSSRTALKRIKG
jgi:hypothetical protein